MRSIIFAVIAAFVIQLVSASPLNEQREYNQQVVAKLNRKGHLLLLLNDQSIRDVNVFNTHS